MSRTIGLALALALLALFATQARAASVAYLDGNEVWIASLDGSNKLRLSEGEGQWRAVTAADSGRVLGVANEAGKISQLSRTRLWDGQGTRISDGPLPSETGWSTVVIPLALDLSSDGQFLAYGYQNFRQSFPTSTLTYGHYVINADTKVGLTPIGKSGETYPSFYGRDIVAVAARTNEIDLQTVGTGPFGTSFSPWFETTGAAPLEQRRVDVAATGTVAAFELERYDGGGRAETKIGVLPIAGIGGALNDPAGCILPTSGFARDVSISPDATRIAWADEQGVKVAGIPDFSGVDSCNFTSAPVVISPTGSSPSIGGIDAAAITRSRTPAPPAPVPGAPAPGGGTTPTTGVVRPPGTTAPGATTGSAALTVSVPSRGAVKALTGRSGLPVTVRVPRAGTVVVRATVPGRRLGRRSNAAVTVAQGTARARGAGSVRVVLKRTAAGRRSSARLRGARVTLRMTQGTLRSTRTVTLR